MDPIHQEDVKKKPTLHMHAPNYRVSNSMSQEVKGETDQPIINAEDSHTAHSAVTGITGNQKG